MKFFKETSNMLMMGGIALLAVQPVFGETNPRARTLEEVSSIRLDSAACPANIRDALISRGFQISQTGPTDAVLQVDVQKGDSVSNDGSQRPIYSAKLRGENSRLLFMAAGDREARSSEQFCKGIAEDIVNRLKRQDRVATAG